MKILEQEEIKEKFDKDWNSFIDWMVEQEPKKNKGLKAKLAIKTLRNRPPEIVRLFYEFVKIKENDTTE